MSDNSSEQEPSIEEILSSIRQIISDDEEDEVISEDDLKVDDDAVADPIHHDRDDILELSEENLVPEEAPEPTIEPDIINDIVMQDAEDDSFEDDIEDEPDEIEDDAPVEVEMRSKIEEELANIRNAINSDETDFANEEADDMSNYDEPDEKPARPVPSEILSSGTQSAAIGSLSKLASKMPVNSSRSYDGVTLEDIVREMLHPMMREWMDDNLPPMVERIVQKEIEKLSRRAMDDY